MSEANRQSKTPLAFSMNDWAATRADFLEANSTQLDIAVHRRRDGSRLIDAGVDVRGSLEAGRHIAEICMGGLGQVDLTGSHRFPDATFEVMVRVSQSVTSCLGSQYAGWSLTATRADDTSKTWRAMASGPGRALCLKEELFDELGFSDGAPAGDAQAVFVLETDRIPPESLSAKVATDCGVDPRQLTFILTPTGSFAGVVQIAARVVEVALHKAHVVGFDLDSIHDGLGMTPLPPPTSDGLVAMGRTNDTILFAGSVQLFVSGDDSDAESLAKRLPSSNSSDYGKPFAQVFKDYEFDFFKIDPELFSPAHVRITNITTGSTFEAGATDAALLTRSFTTQSI